MNNHKLIVTAMLGNPVMSKTEGHNMSRIFIDDLSFQGIRQSSFASYNKESPRFFFSKRNRDHSDSWYEEFNFNGVLLRHYRGKIDGVNRSSFLMKTEDAESLLNTELVTNRSDVAITDFDLNIVSSSSEKTPDTATT